MARVDLQSLLDLVRSYIQTTCPGEIAAELRIVLLSGRKVTHPVPACAATPPAGARQLPPARHSIDFRSVHWFGADYTFTAGQAACVRVLWDAWENGTPEVSQAAVLEAAGSTAETLRALFQSSAAWQTLIRQGQKGSYYLAEPGAEPETPAGAE